MPPHSGRHLCCLNAHPICPPPLLESISLSEISMKLARLLCSLFLLSGCVSACIAKVAELADAPDLGSGGETRGGSSPPFRTKLPPLRESSVSSSSGRGIVAAEFFVCSPLCPNWSRCCFLGGLNLARGLVQ